MFSDDKSRILCDASHKLLNAYKIVTDLKCIDGYIRTRGKS